MAMRDSEPCETVFQTDFGMSRLSADFVREAATRWPDRRCTRNPKWARMIMPAITALHAQGDAPHTLHSISELLA